MEKDKKEWNRFLKWLKHAKDQWISTPWDHFNHITYNPLTEKIEYRGKYTLKTGELEIKDFERMFDKYGEYLQQYWPELPKDKISNDLYISMIVRTYNAMRYQF